MWCPNFALKALERISMRIYCIRARDTIHSAYFETVIAKINSASHKKETE